MGFYCSLSLHQPMLKDFIKFIIRPERGTINNQPFGSRVRYFIFFWLVLYLTVFVASLISRVTCNLVLLLDGTDLLRHYRSNFNSIPDRFGFSILLVGILIAPLTEELAFRLPLLVNRSLILLSGCSYLAILTWNLIISGNHIGIGTIILPVIGFSLLYINYIITASRTQDGFKYMVYISCFLFAIVHILNYRPLSVLSIILSPLVVAPILLMGFGFAFMRLRFGFFWGLAAHMLINIPGILAIYQSSQPGH